MFMDLRILSLLLYHIIEHQVVRLFTLLTGIEHPRRFLCYFARKFIVSKVKRIVAELTSIPTYWL